MDTPQISAVHPIPAAQWATDITQSLSQFGNPSQVAPPDAAPAGEEAEMVVWGAGEGAFCFQKVRGPDAPGLVAIIHNPNYPDVCA